MQLKLPGPDVGLWYLILCIAIVLIVGYALGAF